MTEPTRPGYSRRTFLGIAAGAGASAVIGGIGGGLLVAGTRAAEETAPSNARTGTTVAFEGAHQAGIARPGVPQPNAVIASFDVVASVAGRPRGRIAGAHAAEPAPVRGVVA